MLLILFASKEVAYFFVVVFVVVVLFVFPRSFYLHYFSIMFPLLWRISPLIQSSQEIFSLAGDTQPVTVFYFQEDF